MWAGRYKKLSDEMNAIDNIIFLGITHQSFSTADELKDFMLSNLNFPILSLGYIATESHTPIPQHSAVLAEINLESRIRPEMFAFIGRSVDLDKIEKIDHRECGEDLRENLDGLFGYTRRVRAAVELNRYVNDLYFVTSRQENNNRHRAMLFLEWKHLAARDAAVNLFHFQKSFEYIRQDLLRRCEHLRAGIDVRELRLAWGLFQSWFKDVVPMRNVVAHTAEFFQNVKGRKQHTAHKGVFIYSVMMNDTLQLPKDGGFVTIVLSDETVDRLEKVANKVADCFVDYYVDKQKM